MMVLEEITWVANDAFDIVRGIPRNLRDIKQVIGRGRLVHVCRYRW